MKKLDLDTLLQIDAGARGQPKQRIDILNERFTNKETDLNILLDALSFVVAKQKKNRFQ